MLCEPERKKKLTEGTGLCYHALEAWARGSGFSAQGSHTGNTKYLHLLCSQAPSMLWGMGAFQVSQLLASLSRLLRGSPSPPSWSSIPVLQALLGILWACGKPHWRQHPRRAVRGEIGVGVDIGRYCL